MPELWINRVRPVRVKQCRTRCTIGHAEIIPNRPCTVGHFGIEPLVRCFKQFFGLGNAVSIAILLVAQHVKHHRHLRGGNIIVKKSIHEPGLKRRLAVLWNQPDITVIMLVDMFNDNAAFDDRAALIDNDRHTLYRPDFRKLIKSTGPFEINLA